MVNRTRGRRASKNGAHNEQTFLNLVEMGNIPFVQQFPFPHPWTDGKGDVLLLPTSGVRIVVQNKNQNSSGTCDEKVPFQFDIARWAIPTFAFDEFWLVLGGTYWTTSQGGLRVAVYNKLAEEFNLRNMGVTAKVFLHPSDEMLVALKRYAAEE